MVMKIIKITKIIKNTKIIKITKIIIKVAKIIIKITKIMIVKDDSSNQGDRCPFGSKGLRRGCEGKIFNGSNLEIFVKSASFASLSYFF